VWCSLRGAYWNLKCYLDEHWTQGSVVQTRQRTMDFKGDKVHSTSSFGAEVKPSVPCRKILWHVKNPTNMKKILRRQNSTVISSSRFSCFANRWLLHIFISNHIYTLVKLTHQTRFGPNWAIFSDTLIKSQVPHWFTFKTRYNFKTILQSVNNLKR
jgi:hypothetical protein